jgi:hypothetical protein
MKKALILFFLVLSTVTLVPETSKAQCAMCTAVSNTANQEDEKRLKGLNDGILYLLAMPYIAVAGFGFLWWKRNKKKEKDTNFYQ